MNQATITIVVLIFTIIALISHKIPAIVVGLLIPLVLAVAGVIPAADAYTGLGSKTIFLIIGALALGDACNRTGLTDLIGAEVLRFSQRFKSEAPKLVIIGLLAATMSAFLSSFSVQVVLLSLIIVMAQSLRLSKTRSLLLLGYASTLGGTWSIIGTTNMVMAKSTYESLVPGESIGMFEMSVIAVPVGLIAILLYCFITSKFVPDREMGHLEDAEPEPGEPAAVKKYARRDQIIVAVTFVAFIVLVALDGMIPLPSHLVSVLTMIALCAFGVSSVRSIVECINWDMIFLITGITVLSDAMASSGISEWIGELLLSLAGEQGGLLFILASISVVGVVLTQFMNNSGAFGVILPFLPVIGESLGMSLKPLIVCAALSCSFGFCTMLAAPSYIILAEEGNIQTSDWLKAGILPTIVCVALTVLLIPVFFPA
ncbi:MAG: anion permease [Lachnospiraceae bacterium]|nr:anion permease [Lachnospiraceae bacterium]